MKNKLTCTVEGFPPSKRDTRRRAKGINVFVLIPFVLVAIYGLTVYIRRHKSGMADDRISLFDAPQLIKSMFGSRNEIIQEPSNADLRDVLANLLYLSNTLLPPTAGFRECIAEGRVPSHITHAATFGEYDFTSNRVCRDSNHQPRPSNELPARQAKVCSSDVLYCPIVAATEFIPGPDAPAVTCCLADTEKSHVDTASGADGKKKVDVPIGAPLYRSTPTKEGAAEVFATISLASDEDWGGEHGNRKSPPPITSPADRKKELLSHKRSRQIGALLNTSDYRRPMELVIVLDLSPSMGDREAQSFHDRFNWDPHTKFHQARQIIWNIISQYRRHLNELDRIAVIGIKTTKVSQRGTGSPFAPDSITTTFIKQPLTSASSGNWNVQECINEQMWVEKDLAEDSESEAERQFLKENTIHPVDKTYRYSLASHRAIEKGIALAGQLLAESSGSVGLRAGPTYDQGPINQHILVLTDAFSTTTTTATRYVPEGKVPSRGTQPKDTRTIRGRNVINYSGLKKVLAELGERDHIGVSIAMIGSGDDEKIPAVPIGAPLKKDFTPINASFASLPISEAAMLLTDALTPRLPSNQQSLVMDMVSTISRVQAFPINYFSQLEAFHTDFLFYHLQPSVVDVRISVEPSSGWKLRKVYGNADGFQSEFAAPNHPEAVADSGASTLVHRISALYPKGANRPAPANKEHTILLRFQPTKEVTKGTIAPVAKFTLSYVDVRTGGTVRQTGTIKMPLSPKASRASSIGRFVLHSVSDPETRVNEQGGSLLDSLSVNQNAIMSHQIQPTVYPRAEDIAKSYEYKATLATLMKAASLALYVDLLQEWLNSFQRTRRMPLQAPEGYARRFEQMASWMKRVPFGVSDMVSDEEKTKGLVPLPQYPLDCDGGLQKEVVVLERLSQIKTLVNRYSGYMLFHLPH